MADERYLNRELSWLDFDERVLVLAEEPSTPLLERCKFAAIFSSNLDEFFQIRVAALKDQVAAEVTTPSPDGRLPAQQLAEVAVRVRGMVARQERLWSDSLSPALRAAGIEVLGWDALSGAERETVGRVFDARIFPVLTPLAVDPAHPFPYISNLALNLAVLVRDPAGDGRRFARVKMPANFARVIPTGVADRFVLLEEAVRAHLPRLFPGMDIEGTHVFRVTRNADLSLDDEDAEDLLAAVELELRRRRFGRAVRLEVQDDVPEDVLRLLLDELELSHDDVIRHRAFLDFTALNQLAVLDRPMHRYRPWPPVTAGRLVAAAESGRSFFEVIRERQLLVHHPYESFASSTEAFVAHAAADPHVQSIKATLYRTSGDSSIARQLIAAAESGKQVAAVLELKARFDEARNVSWAKELELAGVHVTYGLVGLKTHAKCILVVRSEADGLRRYVHLGTGNYNAVTARLYEDLGYFTCEDDVGADATELFNSLTGYARRPDFRTLIAAPQRLRRRVVELIDGEASRGAEGSVTVKLNSVSDPEVIDALYRAAAAGASVDLVVRGICCLRAGVPGLSEGVRVRSILGRYLEHSRIYRFGHGLDGGPLHLIGSADLMGRNLDGRVEVLVPVTHPKHREWLDRALGYLLDETTARFEMRPDGSWERIPGTSDAQQRLYELVRNSQVK
ncbi:MAG: polyphosphate kinase 1 [Actinobacteria bacterium]|nr:polyphosphate kinase 1 [Actinomycetota bacterium]